MTKVSKASVSYQNEPKDGKRCDGCTMYRKQTAIQGACTLVMGQIRPYGYCVEHDPK